jgi:pimeloyl-ACP methyl ester carboxylesterase
MNGLKWVAVLAGGGVALVAVAWLGQRRLLYFPARYELAAVREAAAARGLEPWAPVGAFMGWRAGPPGARGTLVVLHGNAGSALDRAYFAGAFAAALPDLPLAVVLAEYPGYGPRAGTPSQASLVAAAREAVREARRELPGPVILAGESLGTAVAALAAAEAPGEVDGLVLVTPLASVPAVGRRHYPFLPTAFFRDPWRADLALPRYGGPVAFLLAGRDEVVFTDLGRALHDAYPGRKGLWVDPGAGHNSVDWRPGLPRWGEMLELAAGRRAVRPHP